MRIQPTIRITLVRHGESVSNQHRRFQGQGDSPLSDLGRTQAAALGRRLAPVAFDRVIASDLSRARETALALGRTFDSDPGFREFDVGAWEGLTREEVEARYPDELGRLRAGEDVAMGGGESYRTFSERIDRALARVCAALEPGAHVLIVCHGGVIGTWIAGQLGLRGRVPFPLGAASNTSLSQLTLDEGGAQLGVYNDASHLWPGSGWPPSGEQTTCVALVADGGARAPHVPAAEHRDHRQGLGAEGVRQAIADLRAQHAGKRVALTLEGSAVWAFARALLGVPGALEGTPEAKGARGLRQPTPGSISHVLAGPDGAVLGDYATLSPEARAFG